MKRLTCLIAALMLLCATALGEGASLTTGQSTNAAQKPVAVVLYNDELARPLLNVDQADVVYEMPITRQGHTGYLAIFNDHVPDTLGHVGQALVMHADLAADWGAALVYVGGQDIAGTSVFDYMNATGLIAARFDGLSNTGYFYRDTATSVPYNAVLRYAMLLDRLDGNALSPTSPMTFGSDYTAGGRGNSVFRVKYNKADGYYPSYQYNTATGLYDRFYNRATQEDASGAGYSCANVIVMQVDFDWYLSDPLRPIAALTGSNRCDYFINGRHITGTWAREDAASNTAYYDDDGNVIIFKPGKTFIHLITSRDQLEVVK